MKRAYETPAAFDRAVKKAVKMAEGDPGEGYRQVLRDRFMCRVFHGGNENFVLKGGSGMLARIPHARATKDLDFASTERISAAAALSEMERIAAIDLGDWCTFRLTKSEESMDENGYSRLLKLRFATFVGSEEKDPVLIDLSLDCTTTLPPERITPLNRVMVEGIESCDYLAYPLPDQLADKLCAIMEKQPNGYPSSRMKDLVDVVTYACGEHFDFRQLKRAIESECGKRGMAVPERFAAPEVWRPRFGGFAKKSQIPERFASYDVAANLASMFYDPVLSDKDGRDAEWEIDALQWVDR